MRRPAVHEQMDDPLGPRSQRRCLGQKRALADDQWRGQPGSRGVTVGRGGTCRAVKSPASESSPPSATAPMPIPERHRSSRRVMTASSSRGAGCDIEKPLFSRSRTGSRAGGSIRSIDKHKLVGQQQHLAQLLPGRKLRLVALVVARLPVSLATAVLRADEGGRQRQLFLLGQIGPARGDTAAEQSPSVSEPA